jgi:hypothetical protein
MSNSPSKIPDDNIIGGPLDPDLYGDPYMEDILNEIDWRDIDQWNEEVGRELNQPRIMNQDQYIN